MAAALEKDLARRRVHEDSPHDQLDEKPTPDEVTSVATDPRVAVPVVKTSSYMASDSGEPLEMVYTAADTLQSKGDDDLTSPDHQAHMITPDDWITEARSELTSRLYYPGMFDRQQNIRPPYPDTFDWLWFYNPFAEFLRGGEKLFWISGESGCGKSTMMRMIECDRRTQECLSSWANGRTLYISSFYLDRGGSALQGRTRGPLQYLLYQLLEGTELPALLDTKSETWNHWPVEDLSGALFHIMSESNACFFLMIDGLDELEGDVEELDELLDVIFDLQNVDGVKFCFSSRLRPRLILKLARFPRLRLHEMIAADVSRFVRGKLTETRKGLVRILMERSEGSFLEATWLAEKVESMRAEGADEETMERRINEITRGQAF